MENYWYANFMFTEKDGILGLVHQHTKVTLEMQDAPKNTENDIISLGWQKNTMTLLTRRVSPDGSRTSQ